MRASSAWACAFSYAACGSRESVTTKAVSAGRLSNCLKTGRPWWRSEVMSGVNNTNQIAIEFASRKQCDFREFASANECEAVISRCMCLFQQLDIFAARFAEELQR